MAEAWRVTGGVGPLLRRAMRVFKRDGLAGVRRALLRLRSQVVRRDNLDDVARARHDYQHWVRLHDTLDESQLRQLARRAQALPKRPRMSVVMPTYRPRIEWLDEAIRSVRAQVYGEWELCIADDASGDPEVVALIERHSREDARVRYVLRARNGHISEASNTALEMASGQWIVLMDHDDLIAPHALYCVALEINRHPEARLIYSDEDKLDGNGQRFSAYFKTDWNPDLFCSHNMFSHLGCYDADLVREVGGFRVGYEGAQDYDLALRCVERVPATAIRHIPRVLYHWRVHAQSTAHTADAKPYAMAAGERAINDHLVRTRRDAHAELLGTGYRVTWALPPTRPLVSIIIPTRNGLEMLRNCLDSIQRRTTYEPLEIIVVDNGSDDPRTLAFLDTASGQGRIRVIRDARPFNYSALNNVAAREARGEVLVLMNNDIEVISPGWLEEMVSHAMRPEVGAVGAKLWYADMTIQHAGLLLGVGGVANSAHLRFSPYQQDYFGRSSLLQSFSAVTAACLAVRRETYLMVGGLNEEQLGVAFNDVDFCLRLRRVGLRNVWTPYAELYHLESASRGYDDSPAKAARLAREEAYMWATWGDVLRQDPAYNPNLSSEFTDFSYAWPPRVAALVDE